MHNFSSIKGHNSDNNWWILSLIKLDLYFVIIYLCMKYESNTPMNSKRYRPETIFCRDGHTDKGDAICPPPSLTIVRAMFSGQRK